MKIKIIAFGSRGDLQPYLSLGIHLQALGHEVTIIADAVFSEYVQQYQLEFVPIKLSHKEILALHGDSICNNSNQIKRIKALLSQLNKTITEISKTSWQTCQNADLILFNPLSFFALSISEKLKIPAFAVYLSPLHETNEFFNYTIAEATGKKYFSLLNKFSWKINKILIWLFFRKNLNAFRQQDLNLPPLKSFFSFYKHIEQMFSVNTIYGFSQHVLSKPKDWSDLIHITGYWFLEPLQNWSPPQTLVNFLNSGEPPIYIAFGSFSNFLSSNPLIKTFLDIIIKVSLKYKLRVILGGKWPETMELPPSFYHIEEIPHTWLFKHVALVVNHGGAGSVAAAIQQGKPQIVVPYSVDQFFWAERVETLKIGYSIKHFSLFSEQSFSECIEKIISNNTIQQHCQILQKNICAENGAEKAAKLISELAKKTINGAPG